MSSVALVLATLAGFLHVMIFVFESVLWTTPRVRAIFGTGSEEDARATQFLAFNQGFYNLFLAVGAVLGVLLVLLGVTEPGWTLVVASCASMLAAATVLAVTGAAHRGSALRQGTLPLLALLAAGAGRLL
ncbi:DUF1304 domain-containing protein [Kineococcus rubinsiae]|uniref:DUF1304 domain-containing protein n=1 Tax=Kineococcus rubinsiae TaxID=2609562 RepID=UPI0014308A2D|nr:DUF1304 domain-containing protein [Kineococcus rubinsiae]